MKIKDFMLEKSADSFRKSSKRGHALLQTQGPRLVKNYVTAVHHGCEVGTWREEILI